MYSSRTGAEALKELNIAIEGIELEDSSKPITSWKSKWTAKDSQNRIIFSDQKNLNKFKATVQLLDSYQLKLAQKGYFDYDDMILKANDALETNTDFKLNIQEQYQYILVDEYQDTNGAQNRLLELLCDNPVYEGRPNLMVVGDPDQAIFSFQGADSSLLLNFANRWQDCKQITLVNNYRSGQKLLDFSKSVLDRANDQADNVSLIAGNPKNQTKISSFIAETANESYYFVSRQIKKLIDSGIGPENISVISKEHSQLAHMLPFLSELKVPVSYERDNNILEQPRVLEIIDLMKLVYSMSSSSHDETNALLAKVLSSEYWNLSTDLWWGIALDARINFHRWSEIIEDHNDLYIQNIWHALKIIAKLSLNSNFELIFSYLIGSKSIDLDNGESFKFPWLDYYFNQTSEIDTDFIIFVSQFNKLKMFFTNWLDYTSENINLSEFIKFIKLINKDYIKLVDHSSIANADNAVTLTTAYKAKGEEWDHVFVLNCNNRLWAKTRGGKMDQFSLPIAYQFIEPASYLKENIVKPFYVSITRAKKELYLNNFLKDDKGIMTEYLDWIDEADLKQEIVPNSNKAEISSFINQDWQSRLLTKKNDYKEAMKPIMDIFKLSATHLNSYLEINDSGINSFIFNNLLRVPQIVRPKVVYGTAMHEAINYLHRINANDNRIISTNELFKHFSGELINSPLTKDELEFFTKKGQDELAIWHKHHLKDFNSSDLSEYKIAMTYLNSDEERLTGEIDLLRFSSPNEAIIVDYKSTSPPAKYSRLIKDPKEYRYRRQLLFYKILIDNIQLERNSKLVKVNTGLIEFLTPDESGAIVNHQIEFDQADIDKMIKLIKVVWQKIINLEDLDTSAYDKTVKGMIALEDDLISGKL